MSKKETGIQIDYDTEAKTCSVYRKMTTEPAGTPNFMLKIEAEFSETVPPDRMLSMLMSAYKGFALEYQRKK